MVNLKLRKEKKFISLSSAIHNSHIEHITYTNKKIIKPLFFIGAVLPDFKIGWLILLVYVAIKYPLSPLTRLKMAYRELKTKLYLFTIRGFN